MGLIGPKISNSDGKSIAIFSSPLWNIIVDETKFETIRKIIGILVTAVEQQTYKILKKKKKNNKKYVQTSVDYQQAKYNMFSKQKN